VLNFSADQTSMTLIGIYEHSQKTVVVSFVIILRNVKILENFQN
jgi:hypothetical protein